MLLYPKASVTVSLTVTGFAVMDKLVSAPLEMTGDPEAVLNVRPVGRPVPAAR